MYNDKELDECQKGSPALLWAGETFDTFTNKSEGERRRLKHYKKVQEHTARAAEWEIMTKAVEIQREQLLAAAADKNKRSRIPSTLSSSVLEARVAVLRDLLGSGIALNKLNNKRFYARIHG